MPELAALAVRVSARRPGASALSVLDLVLRDGVGAEVDMGAAWIQPAAPFGQLLAAALDNIMSPTEWANGSLCSTDERWRYAVNLVWRNTVLEAFAARFGLRLVGAPLVEPPQSSEQERQGPSGPKVDAWDLYMAGELFPDWPFYEVADVILRRPPGGGMRDVWFEAARTRCANDESSPPESDCVRPE